MEIVEHIGEGSSRGWERLWKSPGGEHGGDKGVREQEVLGGTKRSGGIGREGWRTLNGGQWRDWQREVEDTEWRPVEGLAERGGGH
ncbi:unnamed protein product [Staurois parvus]|uniref:Uncharacterized protein n=1 Tax=Staurois parvus TaxID=386267 RepID=A0ABN9DRF1_9NEOB|nr:unnamed protein product [Staurois parvus]